MDVKFSILIPAYKSVFLPECINSILKQSYNNFEIIVVDDASPEDLKSIIDRSHDDRIRYFRNEKNFGAVNVVLNWNKCLEYSCGDYVICMGDDDRLVPNALEEYNKLINLHPGIGLLHGWTRIINEDSDPIALTSKRCVYESAMSLLWHNMVSYNSRFIGDFCYKASSLKERGGFHNLPMAWGSDDVSSIIAATENGVVNSQKILFEYRRNSFTITSTGAIPTKMKAVNMEEEWLKRFLEKQCSDNDDELYRKGILKILPRYLEKKRGNLICLDMKYKSHFRLIYWLIHSTQYKISKKTVLYYFICSFFN